jgi:hypothetical protein
MISRKWIFDLRLQASSPRCANPSGKAQRPSLGVLQVN